MPVHHVDSRQHVDALGDDGPEDPDERDHGDDEGAPHDDAGDDVLDRAGPVGVAHLGQCVPPGAAARG